ncbi:MAG: phosphoribosyltransferase family protein [archaeon GB-1867-035]|nr:phosphoribosyltransferase family protein [Candidatus Culexmicrobium profundum]
MSTRFDSLKIRLMTVEKLRLIKKSYPYSELAKYTGLPEAVLCRYVRGSVLPSEETALRLWKALEKLESLNSLIMKRLRFTPDGYIDITGVIYDPYILTHTAQHVCMRFAGHRINKVMTAAVDGVPLATIVASILEVPLIVAKRSKDVGIREFIEESYPSESPAKLTTLYIPKGAIRSADSVLIVDDIIRTGKTLKALTNLVRKSRGKLEGIFTLMAIGKDWKKKINVDCPIEVAVVIEKPIKRRRRKY